MGGEGANGGGGEDVTARAWEDEVFTQSPTSYTLPFSQYTAMYIFFRFNNGPSIKYKFNYDSFNPSPRFFSFSQKTFFSSSS